MQHVACSMPQIPYHKWHAAEIMAVQTVEDESTHRRERISQSRDGLELRMFECGELSQGEATNSAKQGGGRME
jgi:hypothetical protein